MEMNVHKSDKIDIVKGAAIFAVVFGHTIQYGSGGDILSSGAFFEDTVFKIIYSFHMPLFILISGYLLGTSMERHSLGQIFRSRFTTLVIPILVWSLIPYFIALSQMELSFFGAIKKYIGIILREYWFLWVIFYCSVVGLIVNKYFRDNIVVYLLGMIIALFIPDIYNLQLYKYMYPFFLIGYFYKKSSEDFRKKSYNFLKDKMAICVSVLLYVILLIFYERKIYIYISGFTLLGKKWGEQLGINVYRTLIGLVGSVMVIYAIDIFYNKYPKEKLAWISFMGRKSMGIYIISGVIFSYILPKITSHLCQINYVYSLLQTIIIIVISLGMTLIIQKIPVLNKVLFGGRS